MFINLFLIILLILTLLVEILTRVNLKKNNEDTTFNSFAEVVKVLLPIFALVSMFLNLDYNSYWFVVYVNIYYVLEAFYNLLNRITLEDKNGDKFKPKLLEQKTKKMISSITIVYVLLFHLLLKNSIDKWMTYGGFDRILNIVGLIILGFLSISGLVLILYDFYTTLEFPLFNRIINKTIKDIKNLSYKQLYKKLKFIDNYFVFLFKPEVESQLNLKKIVLSFKTKYLNNESNKKLSEDDQKNIVELLVNFQNSYIK